MRYSFRDRIRPGYKKLQSDLTECPLDESDGGEIVTLTALPGRTDGGFTTANWLLLDGRGYESSDQAFEAGKRWRQYLSVAFARAESQQILTPLQADILMTAQNHQKRRD